MGRRFAHQDLQLSRCGGEAHFCLVEPTTEYGMVDYRVDEGLTEPPRRPISSRGGELPGRKVDGRR
jgi:hypothetical protein